jgi:DNA uptake protein ComE-like DNA-binding protein
MAQEHEAHPARTDRVLWPWISLLPLGFGAWAPIYAGVKAKRTLWIALGLLWSLVVIAGFVFNAIDGQAGHDDLAGGLLIVGWVGAIATSFALRPAYLRLTASPLQRAIDSAEVQLTDRSDARRLVRDRPELARQIGVGRPDLPGATDAGLIDINNAPEAALRRLPGVDADLARQIAYARERVRGFSSLEDMGGVLDLDGALVEGLRDTAVFLPRAGAA